MLMEGKVPPSSRQAGAIRGECRDSAFAAWAATSEGSHGAGVVVVGKLFQLKREFSSVASYKINIQNLWPAKRPKITVTKYIGKKIPFTIQ